MVFQRKFLSEIFIHRSGASRFCRIFFVSQDRNEKLCDGNPFFPESFWYRKILWIRGGISRFQSKFLCLTVPKNFVRESFCFSENFWFRKVLWMKRGDITISVENFWSHIAGKILWASLQCFRKFGVSKNFMNNRGITFFRRNFFVAQYRKISLGKFSVYRKLSGIEKFYASEEGGVSRFSVENFCHTVPKSFFGTVRCFRKFRVSRNFMHKKGISLNSVEKFLSHRTENFRGYPFNVSEILGYRKILCIIGGITFFRRKFFVSQYRKFSLGKTSM